MVGVGVRVRLRVKRVGAKERGARRGEGGEGRGVRLRTGRVIRTAAGMGVWFSPRDGEL